MAFARSEAARYLQDSTSVDPGIADAVVSLAAKSGDAAMFDDYQRRMLEELELLYRLREGRP